MTPLTLFKCLAEETRLKAVLLIHSFEEVCVCDLQSALEQSQPKVSRHLAELRKCGLLSDERRGKWVYYRLHPDLPQWAIDVIAQTATGAPDYFATSQQLMKCASDQVC